MVGSKLWLKDEFGTNVIGFTTVLRQNKLSKYNKMLLIKENKANIS